jgi:hypothetical protein
VRPFEATLQLDRCRLARAPGNYACEAMPDRSS